MLMIWEQKNNKLLNGIKLEIPCSILNYSELFRYFSHTALKLFVVIAWTKTIILKSQYEPEFWFSGPITSLGSYLEDSNMGQFLGNPFQLDFLENGERTFQRGHGTSLLQKNVKYQYNKEWCWIKPSVKRFIKEIREVLLIWVKKAAIFQGFKSIMNGNVSFRQ